MCASGLSKISSCDPRCDELRFAFEPFIEEFRRNFNRHVTAETFIARPIYLSHSAGANFFEYVVRAESFARGQCHVGWESKGKRTIPISIRQIPLPKGEGGAKHRVMGAKIFSSPLTRPIPYFLDF
jgi:hypothetical protein